MRMMLAAVAVAALGLTACGGEGTTQGPSYNDNVKLEIPTLGDPIVILEKIDPPPGTVLRSGQTLTADIRFSFRPQDYPLNADITFWTVIPGYPSFHSFGEGRGCDRVDYATFVPWQTIHCEFHLQPIIYQWWKEDRVGSVILVFSARNSTHTGSIENWLVWKEFPIDYRMP